MCKDYCQDRINNGKETQGDICTMKICGLEIETTKNLSSGRCHICESKRNQKKKSDERQIKRINTTSKKCPKCGKYDCKNIVQLFAIIVCQIIIYNWNFLFFSFYVFIF